MLSTVYPAPFQKTWAADAAGTYVRTVPVPDQTGSDPGAASFATGFPPANFANRLTGGGIPPDGRDMNGALAAITQAVQWTQVGGLPHFDSATSTAIGGYPLGCVLQGTNKISRWRSTVNNNTTDPDGGSAANWVDDSAVSITAATVGTITNLRSLSHTVITKAFVLGYYGFGDGGGGWYYYDSTDTTSTDNGGTIIVASDNARWKLSYVNALSCHQFGAKGDGSTDDTATLQAWANWLGVHGGSGISYFKTYLGRIDFSAATAYWTFFGNGATFRPYTYTQGNSKADGHSEVFYANKNTGTVGSFSVLPVVFRDVNTSGKLVTATSDNDPTGHTDYVVNFRSTSAKWYDSTWQYAKVAIYYGYYHQYGEFWSCQMGAAVFSDATIAMCLDSGGAGESSNENRFFGTKILSSKYGLVIKGGIKNRIYATTVQDMRSGSGSAAGGIVLTTDSTGFGCDGTYISDVYAEINSIPAIYIGTAPNTVIESPQLLSSSIVSDHSYNLTLRNVADYGGGSVTLAHPSGNTDTATVMILGGNILASIAGLDHAGPTYIDERQPAIHNYRTTSPLTRTLKTETIGTAVYGVLNWSGAKLAVPKATATPLFSLTMDTAGTPAGRIAVFTVNLNTWDDFNNATQFGASGHIQDVGVMITCNSSGVPQVVFSQTSAGLELGVAPTFQFVGQLVMSASVSGNVITFSVTWPGGGTGASGMAVQTVNYSLKGACANSMYMKEL